MPFTVIVALSIRKEKLRCSMNVYLGGPKIISRNEVESEIEMVTIYVPTDLVILSNLFYGEDL